MPDIRLRTNRLVTARTKRVAALPQVQSGVTTLFHRMYYGTPERTWQNTTWLGTKIMKCPLDLWVYQELVHRVRPDVILETGTFTGASAHYLATMCDLVGKGRVVSVDIQRHSIQPEPPEHPRVSYLLGSSTAPEIIARMKEEAAGGKVLVILDSDHSRDHVLEELEVYAPLVTPGSYLIVEDTNVNGHPAAPGHGPGPMEAVDEFLGSHAEFTIDGDCEKFYLTFNPRGYLLRA